MGKRLLKVYESSGSAPGNFPCIRLQGRWLERLGFKTGDNYVVKEDVGRLIIELIKENPEHCMIEKI